MSPVLLVNLQEVGSENLCDTVCEDVLLSGNPVGDYIDNVLGCDLKNATNELKGVRGDLEEPL